MQNPTTVFFDILTVERSKCWEHLDTLLVGVLRTVLAEPFKMTPAIIVLKYQSANLLESVFFSGLDILEVSPARQV